MAEYYRLNSGEGQATLIQELCMDCGKVAVSDRKCSHCDQKLCLRCSADHAKLFTELLTVRKNMLEARRKLLRQLTNLQKTQLQEMKENRKKRFSPFREYYEKDLKRILKLKDKNIKAYYVKWVGTMSAGELIEMLYRTLDDTEVRLFRVDPDAEKEHPERVIKLNTSAEITQ